MKATISIFEDRKEEIEFYFSIMLDIDSHSNSIRTVNNTRFLRILKSNLILMLYNLVEACIVSGITQIYESLNNDECTYKEVISEIQDIWSKFQVNQIYGPATAKVAYENRVKQIINTITEEQPIFLTKEALKISGNLDSRKIKEICNLHRIRHAAKDNNAALYQVKVKRNSLSHGDDSFSNCARDLTMVDLESIKDDTIAFIAKILHGMEGYYINKYYRIAIS